MRTWLTPIRLLVYLLIILALWGSISWGQFELGFWLTQARNFTLLFGTGYLVYQVLRRFNLALPTRSEHRLITSLILFVLFDPLQTWWTFILLGFVTELFSRFVRLPTGPVLNPAAVGTLILSLIGIYPGWWATSFAPRFEILANMSVAMLVITPLAGYVAYKYKKLKIFFTAAGVFYLAYWLLFQANPLFILIEGTLIFFLLVMAIEPKTSPILPKQQYLFGAALGLLVVVGLKLNVVEPYVIGLLICNAGFNIYRNWNWLKVKFQRPQTQI